MARSRTLLALLAVALCAMEAASRYTPLKETSNGGLHPPRFARKRRAAQPDLTRPDPLEGVNFYEEKNEEEKLKEFIYYEEPFSATPYYDFVQSFL